MLRTLEAPFNATAVRILPQTYTKDMSLRVELYGNVLGETIIIQHIRMCDENKLVFRCVYFFKM